MTINTTDIKLLESERMSDATDGGGRKTSRVIVDGEPGNIFPKVSRLDSVYGRVNLRKVYGAVSTANLDTYAGAHAVVMDPPDNDRIHVSLFSTGSDYDTRAAARDRIESYVVAGPESRMFLYGRQLIGQQAVLAYQRSEEPLPEVGEVFALSKEVGGEVVFQQFFRITDLAHEVRTFTDDNGEFERRVLTLQTGSPLRYQFEGPESPSRLSSVNRDSKIRGTTVADASRYYGIQKLAEAATENDLTLRVESVYAPIVPTTQRESAISLASIAGALGFVAASSEMVFETPGLQVDPAGTVFFTSRSILPGSLVLSGGASATDDGAGGIVPGADAGGLLILGGTVDYETGRVEFTSNFSGGQVFAEYTPAVAESQPARTQEIPITLSNRGTVYSLVLTPLPAPGSVIVDYRALGKWYRLRDDGSGQVTGNDAAYGVGAVDFVTGALVLTLGALPDADSSVLISWGSAVDYEIRTGANTDSSEGLEQEFTLSNLPIVPGTLSVSFTSPSFPGATVTATADASGVITSGFVPGTGNPSDVTGTVNHTTGLVRLIYNGPIPASGGSVSAAYNQKQPADPEVPVTETGLINWQAPGTLPSSPEPGTFQATLAVVGVIYGNSFSGNVTVKDNGLGLLIIETAQSIGRAANASAVSTWGDTTIGTINYSTGQITIPDISDSIPVTYQRTSLGGWYNTVENLSIDSQPRSYVYQRSGAASVQTARSESFTTTAAPLFLDLTKTTGDQVVPGSVLFSLTPLSDPTRFFDRNGSLYSGFNAATGAAIARGTINYETGRASLSGGWDAVHGWISPTVTVESCLTVYGEFTATDAYFRTAGSPLRAGSFYVQATAVDGALLTATTNNSGVISGAKVRGQVVQDMGIARVEFGQLVGPDWVSIEIQPKTLRYSAVALSNLPLNADILGLDPVRLPSDGRVPIYRPADVVVLHHTDSLTLPNPAVGGATYSMGRTSLSDLWLQDANGARVDVAQYSTDLAAGTVTMAPGLSLPDVPQPLVARHRIEDMQLLSDVQINGQISLTAPLLRDFPADSFVSSALLFGDMNARSTNLFDQNTWTGAWSDTLIGDPADAQFNGIDYPIEVLNDGAVSDRWRLQFTTGNALAGTAQFQVISENLGVVATGNTSTDCAPVNTLTGKPYFVIRSGGWGIGWSIGNQVRFNTVAASAPIWIARTILPGATLNGDAMNIQLRGDVDA